MHKEGTAMYGEEQRDAQRYPQMVSVIDPYVYHTLLQLVGRRLVIETGRGNHRGLLRDVKPDHVVLQVNGTDFFIRIEKINWFMLDRHREKSE
jgi:ferredoxin-fold anticodon binding domain-containing protein